MTQQGETTAGEAVAARNGHRGPINPFDSPAANEKHRQRQEAKVVTEQRLQKWGSRRYAVATLDELAFRWARKLAVDIARKNAQRNPTQHLPELMFSGDRAVKTGASDAHMSALPALGPDDIADLKLRAAAIRRDCQKQVDTLARQIAAERDGVAVTAPGPMTLTALLNEPDEGPTYRVGELWPTAGRVLLAAQFKSGKSTLVGNVIRALVDGNQFLGRFDVTPVGKVALIDTELDKRTLRRWLRAQGIVNTEAVSVLSLRGAVSAFDILDPATRSGWVRQLAGADVVILDCLRPVIDALGLSEDKDAGRLLVAFDALLAELSANEGMVVTHMGHQNERARGDSRLLDWADSLWKIVRDGDEIDDDGARPRFLSALGRDVALPEGQLTYDAATRRLTYADGSRRDSDARAAMPELLALVRAEPGILSKNAAETRLRDDHGIAQKAARVAIRKAITDGSVIVMPGPRNASLLSPGSDPLILPGNEGCK